MSDKVPRIGFVGLGEVGFNMAKGFKEAGMPTVWAYNNGSRQRPPYSEAFKARAKEAGIELASTAQELAEHSDVILAPVVPLTALAAAEEIAPYVSKARFYVDLNACSPVTKRQIADVICKAGGRFVEAQIVGSPLIYGRATPLILGGELAEEFKALMSPYGMDLDVVSNEVGTASVMKMIRDILNKGTQALALEMLMAARRAGFNMNRMPKNAPGLVDMADYARGKWIPLVAIHAKRRVGEMEEVMDTLQSLGVEPIMAEAIRKRLEWCASFELKDYFGGELPGSSAEVFDAIDKLDRAKSRS